MDAKFALADLAPAAQRWRSGVLVAWAKGGDTMARWCEARVLELPVAAAFDMIADVEAYPQFLPMCRQAEVVAVTPDGYDSVQTVGLGILTQRFRTRTSLDRPRRIAVSSSDSLFHAFELSWAFRPRGRQRCRVEVTLDCEVALWWLRPTVEQAMASTAQSMIDAFERRAQSLAAAARVAA